MSMHASLVSFSVTNAELRDLILQLPERLRTTAPEVEAPEVEAPEAQPQEGPSTPSQAPPSRECNICFLEKPLSGEWGFCHRCRRVNGCWLCIDRTTMCPLCRSPYSIQCVACETDSEPIKGPISLG